MAQRPQETLSQLLELFPSFGEWWKDERAPPEDGLVDGVYYQWSHHAVMSQFLVYFGSNCDSFSDTQLRGLGAFLNSAVEANDKLENAVATCFLEHMHQVSVDRLLAPYLSLRAKLKSHA